MRCASRVCRVGTPAALGGVGEKKRLYSVGFIAVLKQVGQMLMLEGRQLMLIQSWWPWVNCNLGQGWKSGEAVLTSR